MNRLLLRRDILMVLWHTTSIHGKEVAEEASPFPVLSHKLLANSVKTQPCFPDLAWH